MTKKALCIENAQELAHLIQCADGSDDAVYTALLSRDVCETLTDGTMQIIPYVTFFTYDIETSEVKVLRYQRPNGNNEERLKDKESLGIGGHIDSEIEYTKLAPASEALVAKGMDHEDNIYKMTMLNLKNTMYRNAQREIKEELGVDVDLFSKSLKYPSFFFSSDAGGVNAVHIGYSVLYSMTPDEMTKFMDSIIADAEEITKINLFTIKLTDIYFDYSKKLVDADLAYFYRKGVYSDRYEGFKKYLSNGHNFEEWSLFILEQIVHLLGQRVWSCVDYKDVVPYLKEQEEKFV